jgi:hypothetical protein
MIFLLKIIPEDMIKSSLQPFVPFGVVHFPWDPFPLLSVEGHLSLDQLKVLLVGHFQVHGHVPIAHKFSLITHIFDVESQGPRLLHITLELFVEVFLGGRDAAHVEEEACAARGGLRQIRPGVWAYVRLIRVEGLILVFPGEWLFKAFE